MNRHTQSDLKQMQSLPLEAKIIMTQERIRAWYESWTRFDIVNQVTGETRFVTMAVSAYEQPDLNENEYIDAVYPGQVYVSFSGGKDSTVLKHIVDSMYDDVPALFVNTGLEYPEIQKFAMSQKNVVTVRPKMRFDEVLKKYGYPVISKRVAGYAYSARRNPDSMRAKWLRGDEWTKFVAGGKYTYLIDAPFWSSARCCDVMKKAPAKKFHKETGRMPMTGSMACESTSRADQWMKNGCNGFAMKTPISNPMSFWTEQDVLHYLKKYNVPYCSVYGDIVSEGTQTSLFDDQPLTTTGCTRTGCIFCMFGCQREKEPTRFQQLKQTHPRQYEYCINGGEFVDGTWQPNKDGLGLGYVLDYIGVKYD